MIPLVTLTDFLAIESISLNVDYNKKVRPGVLDAQEFDVRPRIGESFWIDIAAEGATNANYPTYANLMSQHTYTHNGHTYQHPGLKSVIVMYAYARYKMTANVHDTAYGNVMKREPNSEPVSLEMLAMLSKQAKGQADVYWQRVADYLDRKHELYPLWRDGCFSGPRPTGNGVSLRKVSHQNSYSNNRKRWH